MNVGDLASAGKASLGSLIDRLRLDSMVCAGQVAILAYHRVVTGDELAKGYIEPGMYVLQNVFEMQLRWLRERTEILSFDQLLALWSKDEWDERKKYCVLTFDDGWLDNYHYAYPLLRQYRVPATIFLPTNFVGSDEWFWTERVAFVLSHLLSLHERAPERRHTVALLADRFDVCPDESRIQDGDSRVIVHELIGRCKSLTPDQIEEVIGRLGRILNVSFPKERMTVNWEEVSEMAKHGLSFGSHSCSHHLLTRLNEERVRWEIQESDRVLRTLPQGYLPVFCYPNGDNSSVIQEMVRQSHYVAAVGTRTGTEGRKPRNRFELRRIGMHNDVSRTAPLLSFHLFRSACGF